MSIIPTKFGISFTVPFLNQAGALVHVYTDGSVLLTHGRTEMGQRLHTKMIQVAGRAPGSPHLKNLHQGDQAQAPSQKHWTIESAKQGPPVSIRNDVGE